MAKLVHAVAMKRKLPLRLRTRLQAVGDDLFGQSGENLGIESAVVGLFGGAKLRRILQSHAVRLVGGGSH